MTEDEILNAMDDYEFLEFGKEKLQRFEEIVREADLLKNEALQFEARLGLISAAVFSGYLEKAIVAFSWCIAKSDEKPDVFPLGFGNSTDVLWAYKWISVHMTMFSSIAIERLHATNADFQKRYEESNLSLRPVYAQLAITEMAKGSSSEIVQKYVKKFSLEARDLYSDCTACEQNFLVEVALFEKNFSKAIRYAAPLLSGKQGCAEVPHTTYAMLAIPALNAGEIENGKHFAAQTRLLCWDNPDFLVELSLLIAFNVAVGDLNAALETFLHIYRWNLNSRVDRSKQYFYVAAALLFEHLVDDKFHLSLPNDSSIYSSDGEYLRSELVSHFTSKGDLIASDFDARNQNTFISDELKIFRDSIRKLAKNL